MRPTTACRRSLGRSSTSGTPTGSSATPATAALREELAGYHLEQSYRLRLELAPPDERTSRIGRRAAERLGAAGRRAFAREDLPAAINLLDRALAHAPSDLIERPALLLDLSAALWSTGELARADELLDGVTATAEPGSALALARRGWNASFGSRLEARPSLDEIARRRAGRLARALRRARRRARARAALGAAARLGSHRALRVRAGRTASPRRARGRARRGRSRARRRASPTVSAPRCSGARHHVGEALAALRRDARLLSRRAARSTGARPRRPVRPAGRCAASSSCTQGVRRVHASLYEELACGSPVAGLNQVAAEAELLAGDAAAAERSCRRRLRS